MFHTHTPPGGAFLTHWQLDPVVVLVVLALGAAYVLATGSGNARLHGGERRPVTAGERVRFFSGLAIAFVAFGPPLVDWAMFYSLSAHMAQHFLLTFVVPPLLITGVPAWLLADLVDRSPALRRVGYVMTRSVPSHVFGAAVVVIWHIPPIYDWGMSGAWSHTFMGFCFLAAGVLVWWPICGTLAAWPRYSPPLQCLSLFVFCLPMAAVGAIITFAGGLVYETYSPSTGTLFGLDLATDQQLGGLIMWVINNTVVFGLISVIFLRWASQQEAADRTSRQVGKPASRQVG